MNSAKLIQYAFSQALYPLREQTFINTQREFGIHIACCLEYTKLLLKWCYFWYQCKPGTMHSRIQCFQRNATKPGPQTKRATLYVPVSLSCNQIPYYTTFSRFYAIPLLNVCLFTFTDVRLQPIWLMINKRSLILLPVMEQAVSHSPIIHWHCQPIFNLRHHQGYMLVGIFLRIKQ